MTVETVQASCPQPQDEVQVYLDHSNNTTYHCSDGLLNLLCWCTIYPPEWINKFFRQMCLCCGLVVSKRRNANNNQTVYCIILNETKLKNLGIDLAWPNDGDISDVDPCCAHYCDHVCYTDQNTKNIFLVLGSWILWAVTFCCVKIPANIVGVILCVILVIIVGVVLGIGLNAFAIVMLPFVLLGIVVYYIVKWFRIKEYTCGCGCSR